MDYSLTLLGIAWGLLLFRELDIKRDIFPGLRRTKRVSVDRVRRKDVRVEVGWTKRIVPREDYIHMGGGVYQTLFGFRRIDVPAVRTISRWEGGEWEDPIVVELEND